MWIRNDEVEDALVRNDTSILDKKTIQYCFSNNREFCVFLRVHDAWLIPEEGWRDGNYPPEEESRGRTMINFLRRTTQEKPGIWFKAFVPKSITIVSLMPSDLDTYTLETTKGEYIGNFREIPDLMRKLLTGNAQPEHEIEKAFASIWQP